MRTNPRAFAYEYEPQTPFKRLYINKVTASKLMFRINAESNNEDETNDIYKSLLGLSLCLAFIDYRYNDKRMGRMTKRSRIFLMVIRKAHFEGEDLERMGIDDNLDVLQLSCSVSKQVLRQQRFVPSVGANLWIYPIQTLASELRMYRAIHMVRTYQHQY